MNTRSRTRYFLLSTIATISTLAIAFIFGPRLVASLVSIKLGEPRVVCIGGQGIEFAAYWKVELLDRGDGSWPLMFGVLPLPRSIAGREESQAFLNLSSSRGASFAAMPRPSTFDQAQSLLDCQKSEACSVASLNLGLQYRALVVPLDNGFSATLLDVPLHLLVKGNGQSTPEDVRLRSCT